MKNSSKMFWTDFILIVMQQTMIIILQMGMYREKTQNRKRSQKVMQDSGDNEDVDYIKEWFKRDVESSSSSSDWDDDESTSSDDEFTFDVTSASTNHNQNNHSNRNKWFYFM